MTGGEAAETTQERSSRRSVTVTAVGLMLCASLVWRSSSASFTSTTTNSANTIGAGTVTIADNDGGAALFTLTNVAPGDSASVCMGVRYTGTLTPTAIKLYTSAAQESNNGGSYVSWANDATSEMDDNLSMQIQVNSADLASDPGSSCAPSGVGTFTDIAGTAPGTLMRTMINTNNSYANGLASQWGTITANQWRVFKFTYTFAASAPSTAMGDGLKVTFNWEAQR